MKISSKPKFMYLFILCLFLFELCNIKKCFTRRNLLILIEGPEINFSVKCLSVAPQQKIYSS